jgi:hypothetical protein
VKGVVLTEVLTSTGGGSHCDQKKVAGETTLPAGFGDSSFKGRCRLITHANKKGGRQ